jgi:carboxymethylenebutenolidase
MTSFEMSSSELVQITGQSGPVPAHLARPRADGPRPGVVVIHEIFGLTDHTKDVANRFAGEGYVALAPNLFGSPALARILAPEWVDKARQMLSRLPRRDPEIVKQEIAKLPEPDQTIVAQTVRAMMGGLPKDRLTQDLVAGVAYLRSQPFVRNDRIGSIGFCFGGGMSINLACATGLAACVIFYGENPSPIEKLANVRGAVLGLYGAEDTRINADLDKLVKAMADLKVDFEMRIYPGAGHAFFNDTNPTTYRMEAAAEAWDRVLRFYRRTLQA